VLGTEIAPKTLLDGSELLIENHTCVTVVTLGCRQWDEFVLKIEFYALNLSCIMRIDVKGFVQWGCVSDIPLAGMDCVKYPDHSLMAVSHFISRSCNNISHCNLTAKHRYLPYWLCKFPLVHNGWLCCSPTLPVTCIWLFCRLLS